jgi:Uma2 family endonuclease
MSAAAVLTPLPRLTADREQEDFYEIVDGVRVEMTPMSADSQVVASRLVRHLSNHGIRDNLGEAYCEVLFKLPLNRDRNRKPDVAFVPYSRWKKNKPVPATNAWDVLPDLFVEVVSPFDVAEDTRVKVEEYLESGARLVWVVYPRQRLVDVYDSPAGSRTVRLTDALDGGVVLPGFRLPMLELFPPEELESPPAAT